MALLIAIKALNHGLTALTDTAALIGDIFPFGCQTDTVALISLKRGLSAAFGSD
jgi:hypothetical protein